MINLNKSNKNYYRISDRFFYNISDRYLRYIVIFYFIFIF